MKKAIFLGIIFMVFVLGIGMSARANFEKVYKLSEKERQLLEHEYLEEVRQILLEKGCKNAGVTLTYKTDMDGNRQYTVHIHHKKINKMKEQELALLFARIQEKGENLFLGEVALRQI